MTSVMLRRPGELSDREREAVWRLLEEVDGEFIPPLSSRESTTTKDLLPGDAAATGIPVAYFERLLTQCTLLVGEGTIVGFMSFIPHHVDSVIAAWSPCSYISTIAVGKAARRGGAARRLYEAVLALPPDLSEAFVATRTWSTNRSHLGLLASLGFGEVAHLPDDRGPGVATVYYARPWSSSDARCSERERRT